MYITCTHQFHHCPHTLRHVPTGGKLGLVIIEGITEAAQIDIAMTGEPIFPTLQSLSHKDQNA